MPPRFMRGGFRFRTKRKDDVHRGAPFCPERENMQNRLNQWATLLCMAALLFTAGCGANQSVGTSQPETSSSAGTDPEPADSQATSSIGPEQSHTGQTDNSEGLILRMPEAGVSLSVSPEWAMTSREALEEYYESAANQIVCDIFRQDGDKQMEVFIFWETTEKTPEQYLSAQGVEKGVTVLDEPQEILLGRKPFTAQTHEIGEGDTTFGQRLLIRQAQEHQLLCIVVTGVNMSSAEIDQRLQEMMHEITETEIASEYPFHDAGFTVSVPENMRILTAEEIDAENGPGTANAFTVLAEEASVDPEKAAWMRTFAVFVNDAMGMSAKEALEDAKKEITEAYTSINNVEDMTLSGVPFASMKAQYTDDTQGIPMRKLFLAYEANGRIINLTYSYSLAAEEAVLADLDKLIIPMG